MKGVTYNAGLSNAVEANDIKSATDILDDIEYDIEIQFDNDVQVYADGSWEQLDNNPAWANSPDNVQGNWYDEEYEVYLDDSSGIVDRVNDLIEDKIHEEAGLYHIEGQATLCYIISGLERQETPYEEVVNEEREVYE